MSDKQPFALGDEEADEFGFTALVIRLYPGEYRLKQIDKNGVQSDLMASSDLGDIIRMIWESVDEIEI